MERILLVDDEADVLDAVAARLGDGDREILTARDGIEALNVLAKTPVDLMVLDLRLPRMDGISLLARLRGDPAHKPPVLVLTAYGSPGVHEAVLQYGADDYLDKPFEGRELARRVDGLLGRRASDGNRPRTVLVLDDDPDFRQMVDDRLSATGYCVRHTGMWTEAVHLLQIEKPDIVLVDLGLPEIDGHHACFSLRHDPRFKDTPVIVVTACDDPVQHEKARHVGADVVVTKPIDWWDLEDKIKRLTGTGHE